MPGARSKKSILNNKEIPNKNNNKTNIEFKRNPDTGLIEAWKDDKQIGEIITMEDLISKEPDEVKCKSNKSGFRNNL